MVIKIPAEHQRTLINPGELKLHARFDLPAKVAFAEALLKGRGEAWSEELYAAHIRAFNGFFEHHEGVLVKRSKDDFVESFRSVVRSIAEHGFRQDLDPVPVSSDGVPINGAHRVAACIAAGRDVLVEMRPEPAPVFDYRFFAQRGLGADQADLIARLAVRRAPDMRAALVWPAARAESSRVHDTLEPLGDVVYCRPVHLPWRGLVNVVRVVYERERWRGGPQNGYAGAQTKATACYADGQTLYVALFVPKEGVDPVEAKAKIREHFGVGRSSIHVCDTYEETLRVAEILCHEAGRQYLELAPLRDPSEDRIVEQVQAWIGETQVAPGAFCVGGSVPLGLLGIRPARDIDVLCADPRGIATKTIGLHNDYASYYGASVPEIVDDPRLYFIHRRIKWCTPELTVQMKRRRGEPKDLRDVRLYRMASASRWGTLRREIRYRSDLLQARLKEGLKHRVKRMTPESMWPLLRALARRR